MFLTTGAAFGQPTVSYDTTADWGTGFNGQIKIQNNGSTAVTGWTLEFDFGHSVDLLWDAKLVSHDGNHYKVQSAGWNDRIEPGAYITFGFGGSPGSVTDTPQNIQVTASSASTITDPATNPPPATGKTGQITIAPTGKWDGGFGANVTVVNTDSAPMSAWNLSLTFPAPIVAMWNVTYTQNGSVLNVNGDPNTTIVPGGSVTFGFTAAGTFVQAAITDCRLNGVACTVAFALPAPVATDPISIEGASTGSASTQLTIDPGVATFKISLAGQTKPKWTATSSTPEVMTADATDGTLTVTGIASGRASLRLQESTSGATRYIGVRVRSADGKLPTTPKYLSIGSVSEDTADHLGFWRAFQPGPKNRRVDARYVYLNGGPVNGWDTWGTYPGDRAVNFIRNSRTLGMIPFFVYYNIPDGSEGYDLDVSHVQNDSYMQAYFRNLKLTLDLINQESPDDVVGMVLEPDFLGYLAQNSKITPGALAAATSAVYTSGLLSVDQDPAFPNTVTGLVKAINYVITKYAPQVYFGWQMNLWASPAGGFTTTVPNRGLMHKTDTAGITTGRAAIYTEASAITKFYIDAGVSSYGARFISIDKYGLDATGLEASAAQNPANSIWFWNNDLWTNYLTFVKAMHDTSRLPVVLWQLPVGHINSTFETNPYTADGKFPDLANTHQRFEDSTGTYFFGDTFTTIGARFSYFSSNGGGDTSLAVDGSKITWGGHMKDAASAGVVMMLFGAGVGESTTNVGNPPTDTYWWITKAQKYFANPVPLQ